MAGVGIKLNKIFEKNTITTNLIGIGYSIAMTITPMLLVIADIVVMQRLLGYNDISYYDKQLLMCTILYVFIFSLLVCSPFDAILSKFVSDATFEEKYEEIMPCYYTGLLLEITLGCCLAVPFCIHEYLVGKVDFIFVFVSFCCFISLILVFYTMLYLTRCKDYAKVSFFYLIGLTVSVFVSLLLVYVLGMGVALAMLISMTVGFLLIACLGYAMLQQYFKGYTKCYKKVFHYLRRYWKLIAANFTYTLGLYIHNFIFWTSDLRITVAKSFVCVEPYDMATCLAMFTNISASVIFITLVEMHFHVRYKQYSEAIIGGRWSDIVKTKQRMFRQLTTEIMNLVRIQFVISVVLYLVIMIFLPRFGYSGMVTQIYPCLTAGYFVLFIMYSSLIFLYYFDDLNGAMCAGIIFLVCTGIGTFFSMRLESIWFGLGLFVGAFIGWTYSYFRLRWLEKNIDKHVFCDGNIIKSSSSLKRPSGKVFDRRMN
jgi:uncharacterized membrane protein